MWTKIMKMCEQILKTAPKYNSNSLNCKKRSAKSPAEKLRRLLKTIAEQNLRLSQRTTAAEWMQTGAGIGMLALREGVEWNGVGGGGGGKVRGGWVKRWEEGVKQWWGWRALPGKSGGKEGDYKSPGEGGSTKGGGGGEDKN